MGNGSDDCVIALPTAEEAIYNALCMAVTMTGFRENKVETIPLFFLEAETKSKQNEDTNEH